MGRRKSRKVHHKAAKDKVPTTFDCPFCNHEKTVFCKLDRKAKIALLRCRVCGSKYQTEIHYLSEPIDVYGEWLEECEKANKDYDPEVDAAGGGRGIQFGGTSGGFDAVESTSKIRSGGLIDDDSDDDDEFSAMARGSRNPLGPDPDDDESPLRQPQRRRKKLEELTAADGRNVPDSILDDDLLEGD